MGLPRAGVIAGAVAYIGSTGDVSLIDGGGVVDVVREGKEAGRVIGSGVGGGHRAGVAGGGGGDMGRGWSKEARGED